jgi:hypothetical protein
VTNAVPIAAGFVLFGETLPHGFRAVAQVLAFGCLILSAVALGRPDSPDAAPAPAPDAAATPAPEEAAAPAPDATPASSAEPAGESPPA